GIYDLSTSMTAEEMIEIMCGINAEEETETAEEVVAETVISEAETVEGLVETEESGSTEAAEAAE
nr:hypothetical protein [Lachnospiraceae bacterium]